MAALGDNKPGRAAGGGSTAEFSPLVAKGGKAKLNLYKLKLCLLMQWEMKGARLSQDNRSLD